MDPGTSAKTAIFLVSLVIPQVVGFPQGYANFGHGNPYSGSYPHGMLPQGIYPSFGQYGESSSPMGSSGGQMMDFQMQGHQMGGPFGYGGSGHFQGPAGMPSSVGHGMMGPGSFSGGSFPGFYGAGMAPGGQGYPFASGGQGYPFASGGQGYPFAAGGQGYPFAAGYGGGPGPFMGPQASFGAPGSGMGSFSSNLPHGGHGSVYGSGNPHGGGISPYGGGYPFAGGFDTLGGGYHPQNTASGKRAGRDNDKASGEGVQIQSGAGAGPLDRSNRTSLLGQQNEWTKLAPAGNPAASSNESTVAPRPATDPAGSAEKSDLGHAGRIKTATR